MPLFGAPLRFILGHPSFWQHHTNRKGPSVWGSRVRRDMLPSFLKKVVGVFGKEKGSYHVANSKEAQKEMVQPPWNKFGYVSKWGGPPIGFPFKKTTIWQSLFRVCHEFSGHWTLWWTAQFAGIRINSHQRFSPFPVGYGRDLWGRKRHVPQNPTPMPFGPAHILSVAHIIIHCQGQGT